jgi:hypothetical protein
MKSACEGASKKPGYGPLCKVQRRFAARSNMATSNAGLLKNLLCCPATDFPDQLFVGESF